MQDLGANARVGILGGTLDPIHVGHIETALAARNALSLSRILVMPSRIPPHRTQSPAASMFHRFAMASLAVQSLDTWLACDDELREDGPSYTALTLERLAQRGLPAGRTFFITGADAFAEIETWHRYPEVLDLAHFVVISRPGMTAAAALERVPGISERLQPAASPHRSATACDFCGRRAHARRIVDRHPQAAARRPEHQRPRAAGGRGPHHATPFVRRTPDGEDQQ